MNNIFDSHGHYTESAFDADRKELLESLPEKGVRNIVTVAASLEDCPKILQMVSEYDYIYGALGVHPEAADYTPEDFIQKLEEYIKSSEKIKALGEIGLDYHYENYSKDKQICLFKRQLELAKKLDMPVIIHSRNAAADTMEILREYKPKGVVHCFSGSEETAKEVISLGMYISFTGVLTFKNAKKACKALEEVPLDRLMLETDCPYMAPEPFRGQRCDSSMIDKIALKAGEIKGKTAQEMLDITCENALKFFGIKSEENLKFEASH
ncbi:TatD family hydrolase [Porcipelethomonas sp.]|uniref:TatD family hydrolase n=1 Tax=Porcipelethomonas sp. TaxID=2981675 RepID=UPI003EF3D5D3